MVKNTRGIGNSVAFVKIVFRRFEFLAVLGSQGENLLTRLFFVHIIHVHNYSSLTN